MPKNKKYYKGKGCEHCLNTGYSGRTVISELLMYPDSMRKAIEQDKKKTEIIEIAQKNGFNDFIFDASNKIKDGITKCGRNMPCIKNTIKRINAFSIIELLIIISIISGLVIVAAPSFYGIFKQHFWFTIRTNSFKMILEVFNPMHLSNIRIIRLSLMPLKKIHHMEIQSNKLAKKNHQLHLKTMSI